MASGADRLSAILRASPLTGGILARWSDVALPDGWLVAGAVAQTVWNAASSRAAEADIRDVDIVYFDPDLSADSERRNEARIRGLFAGRAIEFDVKNQARVHLWYESKFGDRIAAYGSVEQAIASFPTTATAVGVRPGPFGLETCAPYGLDDLLGLVVRPNRRQITRAVYEAKVARWRRCWPLLTVVAWDDAGPSTTRHAMPR